MDEGIEYASYIYLDINIDREEYYTYDTPRNNADTSIDENAREYSSCIDYGYMLIPVGKDENGETLYLADENNMPILDPESNVISIMALIHSHGAYENGNDKDRFSSHGDSAIEDHGGKGSDIESSNQLNLIYYVVTPKGNIYKYIPNIYNRNNDGLEGLQRYNDMLNTPIFTDLPKDPRL